VKERLDEREKQRKRNGRRNKSSYPSPCTRTEAWPELADRCFLVDRLQNLFLPDAWVVLRRLADLMDVEGSVEASRQQQAGELGSGRRRQPKREEEISTRMRTWQKEKDRGLDWTMARLWVEKWQELEGETLQAAAAAEEVGWVLVVSELELTELTDRLSS
jgi:hypothetical protein